MRCREIAGAYRVGLEQRVWVPQDRDDEEPVYHNFIIQTDRRDALMHHLTGRGVGTRIHYPVPIHLQRAARDLEHEPGAFPVTERHVRTILSLPIYPELQEEEVGHVIESILEFFQTGPAKRG